MNPANHQSWFFWTEPTDGKVCFEGEPWSMKSYYSPGFGLKTSSKMAVRCLQISYGGSNNFWPLVGTSRLDLNWFCMSAVWGIIFKSLTNLWKYSLLYWKLQLRRKACCHHYGMPSFPTDLARACCPQLHNEPSSWPFQCAKQRELSAYDTVREYSPVTTEDTNDLWTHRFITLDSWDLTSDVTQFHISLSILKIDTQTNIGTLAKTFCALLTFYFKIFVSVVGVNRWE